MIIHLSTTLCVNVKIQATTFFLSGKEGVDLSLFIPLTFSFSEHPCSCTQAGHKNNHKITLVWDTLLSATLHSISCFIITQIIWFLSHPFVQKFHKLFFQRNFDFRLKKDIRSLHTKCTIMVTCQEINYPESENFFL